MGNWFFPLSNVVRVNQVEVARNQAEGVAGGAHHVRVQLAGAHGRAANYRDLRRVVVSCQKEYGGEITLIPGGCFATMYNSRDQVNRDLHDGLRLVSEMVGGDYRPRSVIAGFLSATNLSYLAEH